MATKYESQETQSLGFNVFNNTTNLWKAQTFTPSIGHNITEVQISILREGSPGIVTVSIRATSSGLPTGSDLTSNTFDGDAIGTSYAWKTITLSSYLLAASTKYALIVTAPNAPDSSNKITWGAIASFPSDIYPGGSYCHSSDGSTWTANTLYDFTFQDWGNPTFIPKVVIM